VDYDARFQPWYFLLFSVTFYFLNTNQKRYVSAITGPKMVFLLIENSPNVQNEWAALQQGVINVLQTLNYNDFVMVALVRTLFHLSLSLYFISLSFSLSPSLLQHLIHENMVSNRVVMSSTLCVSMASRKDWLKISTPSSHLYKIGICWKMLFLSNFIYLFLFLFVAQL